MAISHHTHCRTEQQGPASSHFDYESSPLEEVPHGVQEPREDVETHFPHLGLTLHQCGQDAYTRYEEDRPPTYGLPCRPQPHAQSYLGQPHHPAEHQSGACAGFRGPAYHLARSEESLLLAHLRKPQKQRQEVQWEVEFEGADKGHREVGNDVVETVSAVELQASARPQSASCQLRLLKSHRDELRHWHYHGCPPTTLKPSQVTVLLSLISVFFRF